MRKESFIASFETEDCGYDVEVIQSCFTNKYVEIWQGLDVIEFEVDSIPCLISALDAAHKHAIIARHNVEGNVSP